MGVVKMALVRQSDGHVENVILVDVDPDGDYQPPEGYELVDTEGVAVSPGDRRVGDKFERVIPPEPAPAPPTLEDRIAALEAEMQRARPGWIPSEGA